MVTLIKCTLRRVDSKKRLKRVDSWIQSEIAVEGEYFTLSTGPDAEVYIVEQITNSQKVFGVKVAA